MLGIQTKHICMRPNMPFFPSKRVSPENGENVEGGKPVIAVASIVSN